VISGATKERRFLAIFNRGGQPLLVESIRSSCSCVTADATAFTVDSESHYDLPILFDGRKELKKHLSSYLYFKTNQSPDMKGVVRILARIEDECAFLTPIMTLGTLTNRQEQEYEFSTLLKVPSSFDPYLEPVFLPNQLKLTKAERTGANRYRLDFCLDLRSLPASETGWFGLEGVWHCQCARNSTLRLFISGRFAEALELYPKRAYMGRLRPQEEVVKYIVLGERPPQFLNLSSPSQCIAEARRIDPETIRVVVKAPLEPGPFSATLRVSSSTCEILIPLNGEVVLGEN